MSSSGGTKRKFKRLQEKSPPSRQRLASIAMGDGKQGGPGCCSVEEESIVRALRRKRAFVLISGKAGTGKSHLLSRLTARLSVAPNRVAVTAPTGIAAVNIGGGTLHSWFGMGLAKESAAALLQKLRSSSPKLDWLRNRLANTDILFIDEISMVDRVLFANISYVVEALRRELSPTKFRSLPFGGMRVVMFGDFLQLPPVGSQGAYAKARGEKSASAAAPPQYLFETDLWRKMNVFRIHLRHNYRQVEGDFTSLLNQVRSGTVSGENFDRLLARTREAPRDPFSVVTLCSYKHEADTHNDRALAAITDQSSVMFTSEVKVCANSGASRHDLAKAAAVRKNADALRKHFTVPYVLELKVGARVMLRCNLSEHGLCNGSTGVICGMSLHGQPQAVSVLFDGKESPTTLEPHKFALKVSDDVEVCVHQIPLTLGYACTIHKCQGLTLDRTLVKATCFERGQFYTALSRVRTLRGLFIAPTSLAQLKKAVRTCPKALRFERDLGAWLLLLATHPKSRSPINLAWQKYANIADSNVLRAILSYL